MAAGNAKPMRIWSSAGAALGALVTVAALTSSTTAAPPVARKAFSAHDAEAKALLATMTLEEKVGQMTQAEQEKLTDVKDIQTYFLGSLLSGGSSDPKAGNSLQAWTDMQYLETQRARGGTLIVVDPRRTRTAEAATLLRQPLRLGVEHDEVALELPDVGGVQGTGELERWLGSPSAPDDQAAPSRV